MSFCEATNFAPEKWPFKRGGLLSGVETNIFIFRLTLSTFLKRAASHRRFPCTANHLIGMPR